MPKKKAPTQTSTLTEHNFLPQLGKPQSVVGDFIAMAGREWSGCPAADKDKWFRCVVRDARPRGLEPEGLHAAHEGYIPALPSQGLQARQIA